MKQLVKNAISLLLETIITLCEGYFYLFFLGSIINALNNAYVLKLTLCTLFILIISNKIKGKVS